MCQDGCGRIILKVTVEVSEDASDTILVREGDDAQTLAKRFCSQHDLQENLVAPLTAHIQENLKKVAHDVGNDANADRSTATGGPTGSGAAVAAATGAAAIAKAQKANDAASMRALPPAPPRATTPRPQREDAGPGALLATPAQRIPGIAASTKGRKRSVAHPRASTPAGTPRGGAAEGDGGAPPSTPGRSGGGGAATAARAGARLTPRSGARSGRPPRTPAGATGATPRLSEVRSPSPGGGDPDAGGRFERLHQDATLRQLRLDRLRQQVERDIEDQHQRGSKQVAPGTLRCASWNRDPEGGLGDRLYRDAVQRQAKIKHLQTLQAELKRQEEERETTFSPAICTSQRSCRGVGRSMRDPEGAKTKRKIESLRQIKENSAMDGCTFRPEIDHKSEALMMQRISRLKITGSLYDHLYGDAQRRQEKQLEYDRSLPPGVTFQPDIGVDHHRPPNDDTTEDFVNRLAYSKCYSERWLAMRKQQQEQQQQENRHPHQHQQDICLSQDCKSQPDFHPRTGRAPSAERNKERLPIGEFLYESGREKALQSQVQLEEEEERERSQSSASKIGAASRQLFEETKLRKYKNLYEALVRNDPDQRLRCATLTLDGLAEELAEFLRPIIARLKETRSSLEFEGFCTALDHQRRNSMVPTAHLFVERCSSRTSDRYRQECDGEVFTPRTDARSNRIAARHRPRGAVPLHEQLVREKEVWDSKLHEQRVLQDERKLQECTFQPNSRRPRSAGASGSRRRGGGTPGRSPRACRSRDPTPTRADLKASRSDPLLGGGTSPATMASQERATPRAYMPVHYRGEPLSVGVQPGDDYAVGAGAAGQAFCGCDDANSRESSVSPTFSFASRLQMLSTDTASGDATAPAMHDAPPPLERAHPAARRPPAPAGLAAAPALGTGRSTLDRRGATNSPSPGGRPGPSARVAACLGYRLAEAQRELGARDCTGGEASEWSAIGRRREF